MLALIPCAALVCPTLASACTHASMHLSDAICRIVPRDMCTPTFMVPSYCICLWLSQKALSQETVLTLSMCTKCAQHCGAARQLYLLFRCTMGVMWTPPHLSNGGLKAPVAGVMCFRGTAVQLRHVSGPPRASRPQHCVDSPVHSSRHGYDSPAGSPAAGTANSCRCGGHGDIHCPDCPPACGSR